MVVPPWTTRGRNGHSPLDDEGEGLIPSPSHSEGDASKRSDARRGCPSQPNRSRQLERPTPPNSQPIIQITQITVQTTAI